MFLGMTYLTFVHVAISLVAIVLGAGFTALAIRLWRTPSNQLAMRVFSYSITYVTLLFGAMALDQLVRSS